mmetsp:Transcript_53719/g.153101  ORF Transcript_53719/g.153101 Transcript_53719/m.153101 type:complete len:206 (+) Transcript_53719:63-680(+)
MLFALGLHLRCCPSVVGTWPQGCIGRLRRMLGRLLARLRVRGAAALAQLCPLALQLGAGAVVAEHGQHPLRGAAGRGRVRGGRAGPGRGPVGRPGLVRGWHAAGGAAVDALHKGPCLLGLLRGLLRRHRSLGPERNPGGRQLRLRGGSGQEGRGRGGKEPGRGGRERGQQQHRRQRRAAARGGHGEAGAQRPSEWGWHHWEPERP